VHAELQNALALGVAKGKRKRMVDLTQRGGALALAPFGMRENYVFNQIWILAYTKYGVSFTQHAR